MRRYLARGDSSKDGKAHTIRTLANAPTRCLKVDWNSGKEYSPYSGSLKSIALVVCTVVVCVAVGLLVQALL